MKPRSKILEAPGTEVKQLDTSPAVQVSAVTMRMSFALARSRTWAAWSSISRENIVTPEKLIRGGPQPPDCADRARLDVLHVQADVDRPDAMGKVAYGDHVHSGFGDRYDCLLIDAAGGFGDRPLVDELQTGLDFIEIHIVEHNHFNPAIERFLNHVERFTFDFELECMLGVRP